MAQGVPCQERLFASSPEYAGEQKGGSVGAGSATIPGVTDNVGNRAVAGRWGGEERMSAEANSAVDEQAGIIWARRSDITAFSPAPGIRIQPVVGGSMMTCWIAMEPGAVVARHAHSNEQLGVLVEGTITLTAGGETRTLEPGDAYAVPPDVPHEGVAGPEGATLVETFVPARDDYVRAWRAAAGQ
jgi:quercetin dioxygenase-like cupin family protein